MSTHIEALYDEVLEYANDMRIPEQAAALSILLRLWHPMFYLRVLRWYTGILLRMLNPETRRGVVSPKWSPRELLRIRVGEPLRDMRRGYVALIPSARLREHPSWEASLREYPQWEAAERLIRELNLSADDVSKLQTLHAIRWKYEYTWRKLVVPRFRQVANRRTLTWSAVISAILSIIGWYARKQATSDSSQEPSVWDDAANRMVAMLGHVTASETAQLVLAEAGVFIVTLGSSMWPGPWARGVRAAG